MIDEELRDDGSACGDSEIGHVLIGGTEVIDINTAKFMPELPPANVSEDTYMNMVSLIDKPLTGISTIPFKWPPDELFPEERTK